MWFLLLVGGLRGVIALAVGLTAGAALGGFLGHWDGVGDGRAQAQAACRAEDLQAKLDELTRQLDATSRVLEDERTENTLAELEIIRLQEAADAIRDQFDGQACPWSDADLGRLLGNGWRRIEGPRGSGPGIAPDER